MSWDFALAHLRLATMVLAALVLHAAPSDAADMSALRNEIEAANYAPITPPEVGQRAGMLFRRIAGEGGRLIPDVICNNAFDKAPESGKLALAHSSYERSLKGGIKITFLPGLAKAVDLSAELAGGRILKYSVMIDQVETTTIPPAVERKLAATCAAAFDAKGVAKTPMWMAQKLISTDQLKYELTFDKNFTGDIKLVIAKLAQVNPNLAFKELGKTTLGVTPKDGRFVIGMRAVQIKRKSDLGLLN